MAIRGNHTRSEAINETHLGDDLRAEDRHLEGEIVIEIDRGHLPHRNSVIERGHKRALAQHARDRRRDALDGQQPDGAKLGRQALVDLWGRYGAVVSTCMQGRSSVAIHVEPLQTTRVPSFPAPS